MADDLKHGDRVRLRNGELGTVVSIDGGFVMVQLDSSLRKAVAPASLTKLDAGSDPADRSNGDEDRT